MDKLMGRLETLSVAIGQLNPASSEKNSLAATEFSWPVATERFSKRPISLSISILDYRTWNSKTDKIWNTLYEKLYSEKATKFCEISTVDLSYVVPVKFTVDFAKFCGLLRIYELYN